MTFAGTATLPPSAAKSPYDALLCPMPALPAVAVRLLGILGDVEVNLRELTSLILSDAALASEILRISNSALVSSRTEVRSILQALAVLGTEKVKGLACTVALRSYLGNALHLPALKRCWRHNLATALVASELAAWSRQDSGEAYTAGILHDIGRVAMIASDPSRYLRLLSRSTAQPAPLCELEQQVYGFDHAEAGRWLAARWMLPPSLQQAIGLHHGAGDPPSETVALLRFACRIAGSLGFAASGGSEDTGDPLGEFLDNLPPLQREWLRIDAGELQLFVASRINALEA